MEALDQTEMAARQRERRVILAHAHEDWETMID